MRLKMTQKDIADKLGVARNYVYLMESGRKPVTDTITQKLTELESCQVLATPPPPALPAVSPVASDLAAEVAQVRADLARMTAQLDTVTRLLGAALGNGLSHTKEPRHRAAG